MNLLQTNGGQPQKQPKYVPIFIDRAFTGIWTQRNVLHDPSDLATLRFYGGRPDALIDGSNVELTNKLTLARRPGLTAFSTATYPTPPDRAFAFELLDGTIRVIIDTGQSPQLSFDAVEEISGATYYTFTNPVPCAANNAYAGLNFLVSGFNIQGNNGSFLALASTANYLLLQNPTGTTEVATGVGVTPGAVYWDQQNGTKIELFAKSAGSSTVTSAAKASITGTFSTKSSGGAAIVIVNGSNTLTLTASNKNSNTSPGVGTYNSFFISNFATNTATALAAALNIDGNGDFVSVSATSSGPNVTITALNPGSASNSISVTATSNANFTMNGQSSSNLTGGVDMSTGPGFAGQTGFVAVAGTLYMGDGVDTLKYTPLNNNGSVAGGLTGFGSIWNYSIAAPTTPPTATIVESGASAVTWVASTVFSTMGLIVDANGNAEQLIGVNAQGGNTTQFGLSGNGQPNWSQVQGTTTLDNGITWLNVGQIGSWTANTSYQATQPIYDQATGGIYVVWGTSPVTSGAVRPNFTGIPGGFVDDKGGFKWGCLGNITQVSGTTPTSPSEAIYPWQPSFSYSKYDVGTSSCVEPIALPKTLGDPLPTQPIYLQITENAGTSGSAYNPPWPTLGTVGAQTTDNQLQWESLGSATWKANTAYLEWNTNNTPFNVIKDTNGNFQVCIISGTSGGTQPTWNNPAPNFGPTKYGDTTHDGTVVWSCVGDAMNWSGAKSWYLPLIGFSPPIPNDNPYGSASIIDTNSNVEFVTNSGESGASQPSWNTVTGGTTADPSGYGTLIWTNVSKSSTNSLTWQFGFTYAYSFGARLTTDDFNTTPPPGLTKQLGTPTGSETGGISTASPILTITGSNAGAVINLTGLGSTDPQVDTIFIWRSPDETSGGGDMVLLTEIPAPAPKNGLAQPWYFADFLPDLPTGPPTNFPGLNFLVSAPIDDQNNPPLSNFIPQVYNFQRIWGFAGQEVLWSGGPDVVTGNPNEAYNPSDDFPYLANVVRIVKNSQGLVIFLVDSVEFIGGGPSTQSFYTVTLAPGIGLGNYNALDLYAGEIIFFSSDGELKTINPALQLSNTGFAVGDQLVQMNPLKVYVAIQQAGLDNAFYVADGSTGWFRCNPHQVPGGANGPESIWSPFASFLETTGGIGMVQSVEVSPGNKKLLVGPVSCNQQILERNLNTWTDNGVQYGAFFTMGAIVLAHQSQIALLKHVAGDFTNYSVPLMSYIIDEIDYQNTNNFIAITNPVFDPPSLYGTQIKPRSYNPLRWYFAQTGQVARCRSIILRVDFGISPNPDEAMNLCLTGRIMVEV